MSDKKNNGRNFVTRLAEKFEEKSATHPYGRFLRTLADSCDPDCDELDLARQVALVAALIEVTEEIARGSFDEKRRLTELAALINVRSIH